MRQLTDSMLTGTLVLIALSEKTLKYQVAALTLTATVGHVTLPFLARILTILRSR